MSARRSRSTSTPRHSSSTSTEMSGTSTVSSNPSNRWSSSSGWNASRSRSTTSLSPQEYRAASATETASNGRSARPRPTTSPYVRSSSDSRSRASSSIACERRPGSSTKLASIESYTTPASATPAPRSTSQAYLMLCPALGTRSSASSSRSGASAALAGGGRLRGGVPPASAPSGATCANGRYHERPGATASDMPTSSARIGSSDEVSVSSATSGARRHSATSAASAPGSSTIVGSTSRAVGTGGSAPPDGGWAAAAGALVPTASSDPSFGMSERNSSSVNSSLKRARSGGRTRSPSRSSVSGTLRRMVTRSRDRRATSTSRAIRSEERL